MAKDAVKSATNKPAKSKKDKNEKKSFFSKVTHFFKDLRGEIKKVVWPSKKQVKNNTLVVLAFMAVTAVFIWLLDFIMVTVIRLVLGN